MQKAVWAERMKMYTAMNGAICEEVKKDLDRWHNLEI